MTEPPTTEVPQTSTLVAVSIGMVIGIVAVLIAVLDLSLAEVAVVLVPMLAVATMAGLTVLWVSRRSDR